MGCPAQWNRLARYSSSLIPSYSLLVPGYILYPSNQPPTVPSRPEARPGPRVPLREGGRVRFDKGERATTYKSASQCTAQPMDVPNPCPSLKANLLV